MDRDIKFKLKVDSASGQASIKKTSTQLKTLGATAATSGAAIGAGAKAGAGGMLLMGAATTKAVGSVSALTKDTIRLTKDLTNNTKEAEKMRKEWAHVDKVMLDVKKTFKATGKAIGDQTKRVKASTAAIGGGGSGGGGLVAALWKQKTAILAVAAATTYLIYTMTKESAKVDQQKAAFTSLAESYGVNSDKMLADLKRFSAGTVDTATLVQQAGTAMMMGIDPTKIAELMGIARATAKMTGQTVSQAFGDIALAVGRQSKMILDNLGIIISVSKANETYAKQLGKNASKLTDVERKQAFLNETIRLGRGLVEKLGGTAVSNVEKFQQFETAVKDLKVAVGRLGTALTPVLKQLTLVADYWTGVFSPDAATTIMNEMADVWDKIASVKKSMDTAIAYSGGEANLDPFIKRMEELHTELEELRNKLIALQKPKAAVAPPAGDGEGDKEDEPGITRAKKLNDELQAYIDANTEKSFQKRYESLEAEFHHKYSLADVDKDLVIKWYNLRLGVINKLEQAQKDANKRAVDAQKKLEEDMLASVIAYTSTDEENDLRRIEEDRKKELDNINDLLKLMKLTADEAERYRDAINTTAAKDISEVKDKYWTLPAEQKETVASMDPAGLFDFEGMTNGLKTHKKQVEEIEAIWKKALSAIESNFTDTFGSALRGELNSFQDFFKGFMDSIQQFAAEGLTEMLKTWVETMAKMAQENKVSGGKKTGGAWTSDNTLVAGIAAGGMLVSTATQDSSNAQAYSGAASGALAGAMIGMKYGTAGGGWIGAIVGAVVGGIVGLLAGGDDDDSDKIAEENAKRLREAIAAMALALEQSNKTLDAQLEATHTWSASISSVVKSYDENVKKIYETYGIEREPEGYQWTALEIEAEVIFAKELALIAQSITRSMEDFELSIAKLTMTTYDASMADLEAYYVDVELAISEMDVYKVSLNESLAGYKAQADSAEMLFKKFTEDWSLYSSKEAEIVAGKEAAYYDEDDHDKGTYILPSREEYLEMERYSDNLKAIEEIEGVMGNINTLASDLAESYEESLAALEEYYLMQREIILSDAQKQVDSLSGIISEMTGALESIDDTYKSWADELENLGGTATEIALLQKDWLEALTLVANAEIFDKFDSISSELDLLSFQTAGGSTADYYLREATSATTAGNYISASEFLNAWYNAQKEVTTLWDSVVDNVEALIDNIQQVIDSIKYGSLNVVVPTVKAEEAEKDYAELKAAALAGGTEEIEEFVRFASTYLQLTQDTLKSSDAYQSVYASVMADLVDIQEMAEAGDYDQLIYDELNNMNVELNENLLQVGVDLGQHIENLRSVFEANFVAADYASFSGGGIATGPTSGYLAELHGTEAVIPMRNGAIDVVTTEKPMNINVYIGNEQLDTHIVKQADQVRVKANRRPGNATTRLF